MSDLLIKNLELPKKDRIQLSVYPNGKVINHSSFTGTTLLSIELPPHGRLIDTDLAIAQEKNYCEDCDNWNGIRCKTCEHDWVMMILDDALPVIEASEE